MSRDIIFCTAGNETLAAALANRLGIEQGSIEQRRFPDGETYLRVLSDVAGKNIILACTLDNPDVKILPLLFLAETLRESGASAITLVSPYLSYMRQDKVFKPGEALTSTAFARLLSGYVDRIVTVDPHLHRRKSMEEIYSVPCTVLHAAALISDYVRKNIARPLLIGPDSESAQWVSQVAGGAGAPFIVLEKIRRGDRDVKVSAPRVEKYSGHTPVLVDDIVSSAGTMIETVRHLSQSGMHKPVCIATHGVFATGAFDELVKAGAGEIITCNTIVHPSNRIDVNGMIAERLKMAQ